MREQFGEPVHRMGGDAREHITEPANGSTRQRLQAAMKLSSTAGILSPWSLPKNVQLPRLCTVVDNRGCTNATREFPSFDSGAQG
jgi:hypothetical protein